jgi:hypothetical protein
VKKPFYSDQYVNDLDFLGERLYVLHSTDGGTVADKLLELDPATGSVLNEVLLQRSGDYSGLAATADSVVPEPASLVVWGFLGLMGTCAITRRRFRRP